MNELHITIRLSKIQHLFEIPDISPYSDYYEPYSNGSGMNYVVEKLYVNRKSKSIFLTILLPKDQITPDLEKETKVAISRYSDAWAQDSKNKMSRANYKGIRGLATGAIFGLVLLNGTGVWLSSSSNFILKLISDGLIVAGWVLMWFPLDILTQEFWVNRLDRKVYQKLKTIQIAIKPES